MGLLSRPSGPAFFDFIPETWCETKDNDWSELLGGGMSELIDHYAGEQIVSDESILRRVPTSVPLKERLTADALVLSADVLMHAYRTLQEIAQHVGVDIEKVDRRIRAGIISAAWTIVDQLYAVRQLIGAPQDQMGPLTTAFYEASEPAFRLRNKMDHLASNLNNLANATGHRSPLFGSLTYFHIDKMPPTGGTMVTIMTGSIHGNISMPIVNPAGRPVTYPVDLFELTAFGITLPLGPPLAALKAYIQATEEDAETALREGALKASKEQGIPAEELLAHMGNDFAFAVHIKFNTADDSAPPP